jgi:general secretion pathway protein C
MVLSPRYLMVVNLLLLALAAYAAAGIASTALAARFIPPPEVQLSNPPDPFAPEKPRPASYYSVIHQRDIFNSAKPVEAPVAVEPPKKTQLRVRLWGVAVRGEKSHCVIEDQSARPSKQELYRINDTVAGIATVKAIEWDRVILDHDGTEEILELTPATGAAPVAFASAVPGVSGTTPPSTGTTALPPRRGVEDVSVQVVGENQFAIEQAEVDKAFENLGQLFTQMRAVPHFEGGQSVGFRLFAIRSGSLFDKIGLRNGDIVKRINDNEISDPSRALAMLQALRNERSLSVDLVRNRQEQRLSYTVR